MARAKKDDNQVNTIMGVLNTNGSTPTNVTVDPITHVVDISDGTTGSDFGANNAARDDNNVPVMMAISEDDGSTPVPLYVDSSGNLLIDTI